LRHFLSGICLHLLFFSSFFLYLSFSKICYYQITTITDFLFLYSWVFRLDCFLSISHFLSLLQPSPSSPCVYENSFAASDATKHANKQWNFFCIAPELNISEWSRADFRSVLFYNRLPFYELCASISRKHRERVIC